MESTDKSPLITWDFGTAYDLFVSLRVLHEPDKFDLRASWAAGVRSRLSQSDRETLETARDIIYFPLGWIHSLPPPKDAATALMVLESLPPADRLPALTLSNHIPEELADLLQNVAAQGSWDESDRERLRSLYPTKTPLRSKALTTILDIWTKPADFGGAYLQALQSYQAAFFTEEEGHIRAILQEAVSKARELSRFQSPIELIEELSQGVRATFLKEINHIILAPSYWISPLIVFEKLEADCVLMLFGARPKDISLVPGEAIPDTMLRALKAMADPTRLKILRYLGERPYTPSQLARLLRLRAPTVIHHLNALRLAGLVHLTLEGEAERMYQARQEAIDGTFSTLKEFLETGGQG